VNTVYLPYRQFSYGTNYVALRAGAAGGLAPVLRDRLAVLDPALPLFDVARMEDRLASSLSRQRFSAVLLGLFSSLGLLLALVGAYGVISHAVSGRTREIGIRLSLGASRREVLGLFLREGARWASLGIVAGLAGALLGSRWLAGELFQVRAFDPLVYAVLALAMAAVTALACYLPARRALQVDPVVVLREE
jgi:ABC-type antimicrobial peptide transport system permease subunit